MTSDAEKILRHDKKKQQRKRHAELKKLKRQFARTDEIRLRAHNAVITRMYL